MKLTDKRLFLKINIFSQDINSKIKKRWIRRLGNHVLKSENIKTNGSLSIIFVNDSFIQGLNNRFFKKNNSTDVIAFNLDKNNNKDWGEVYISTDRAAEQAKQYKIDYDEEIARLIIHGILHLIGYVDEDEKTKLNMKTKEDYYLQYVVH